MKTAVTLMLTGLAATSVAALMEIWGHAETQAAIGGLGGWAIAAAAMPWKTGGRTVGLRSAMALVGVASFATAITAVASQHLGSDRLSAEIAMIAGVNLGFPVCFTALLLAMRRNIIRIG